MSLLSLCYKANKESEFFLSSVSLFQARVTDGRKDL